MRWISITILTLCMLSGYEDAKAQKSYQRNDFSQLELHYFGYDSKNLNTISVQDTLETARPEFPSPKSVMLKSLMVPGWGQIQNRQTWKVPIIYGMFAGIGYYTYYLHGQYQDYKAAFYNSFPENTDQRFGPTPPRLQGVNTSQLQSNRNSLRNRRDFMFVVFTLAYGLNAVDAYVYAHMRSFDVSDDLSARAVLGPELFADGSPGIRVTVSLSKK